jgi:hypothetical protein
VLWLRPSGPAPVRVAGRARPNQAVIEQLSSRGGRVAVRRDRKHGTTLIMVSASAGDSLP